MDTMIVYFRKIKFCSKSEHWSFDWTNILCKYLRKHNASLYLKESKVNILFQGVLGHPLRCEYTVIGRKVNMVR